MSQSKCPELFDGVVSPEYSDYTEDRLRQSEDSDSKYSIAMRASIAKWRERQASGGDLPSWDYWCEFNITLANGSTVTVLHDPDFCASHHLNFYGPMTSTGYRSEFISIVPDEPIEVFALQFAEHLVAEMQPKKRGKKGTPQ